MDDPAAVFELATENVLAELRSVDAWPADMDHVRRHVVRAVRRAVKSERARRAVVVPIILEV
jgi:hypothetical protein